MFGGPPMMPPIAYMASQPSGMRRAPARMQPQQQMPGRQGRHAREPQRQYFPKPLPVPNRGEVTAAPPSAPGRPQPTVRLQSPDERCEPPVPPSNISMPTPEQLGLKLVKQLPKLDWDTVHRHLERLGCSCFHVEKTSSGCRVICLLPTGKAGTTHRIDVQAAQQSEALQALLARTEQWAARK